MSQNIYLDDAPMRHKAYVFVEPNVPNLEEAAHEKMRKFDTALVVEPYRDDIEMGEVWNYLANSVYVDIADPDFDIRDPYVTDLIRNWFAPGREVLWDDEKECFYTHTTINPNGQFDNCEIAKSYDEDVITITHEDAINAPPGAAVVDGQWISKEKWDQTTGDYITDDNYVDKFIEALRTHPEDILVVALYYD